ncbi:RHS repeat-associated core domain-containing protein [Xylophilus sp. GW821-FHT01B05]
MTSETDFKGVNSTYTWDTTRRVPLSITRASGLNEAQTTSTQWHPTFNLPLVVTEAGRTTSYTYDALGNKLSETVTDTATGQSQARLWTYNAAGLVATSTEPNGAVTQYAYDSFGNPTQQTDPLGRATQYQHDAAGRITQQTDPNGITSSFTYDLRGRLLTQNQGGLQTTNTYTATGLVASVTAPTGYALTYTYDAAHRLTGWSDNRGASGSYTLDGMGNRTAEQVRDAQNNLAWQVARSINQLNRVASETVGGNQSLSYGYDANGERVSETNALGQTTQYSLDGLRRITQVKDSLNALATLEYDKRDNITGATDFKGAPTSYVRDAQGNATQEASLDAGLLQTSYDALGLPSRITDALGRATDITRDLLGRPTRIQYADNSASVLRYDLSGADYNAPGTPNASIGFLSEIQDPGVTTQYQRDLFGRVLRKQQILADGSLRAVGYSYVAVGNAGAGQIGSITYPSGGVLAYLYDSTGRLTGLDWNGTPLVRNLAWNPLGQPTGWQWPFAAGATPGSPLAASRQYNTAGQLIQNEIASYQWNAAGRITSLTQDLMLPSASGVAPSTFTTAFGYDATGRITSVAHSPSSIASLPAGAPLSAVIGPQQIALAYDPNGNRQSVVYTQTDAGSTLSLQRAYQVQPGSNRLLGYDQTLTLGGSPATSQVAYSYDATGAITQVGEDLYGHGANGRMQSFSRSGSGANGNSSNVTYLYNALGQRLLKHNSMASPAVTTQTVYADGPYDDSTVLSQDRLATSGSNPASHTDFVYLPTASGPLPVATIIDGRLYAIHSDHLNTPRRLTQANGQVAWQWVTTAFGEVPPSTGATGFVQETADTEPTAGATDPVTFDLRYPGQVADEESGLYYNLHRSYNPTTGRYTQADPIGLAGGWNRFAYVEGNPLSFSDSTGLQTSLQWCYQNPANAATCNDAGMTIRPIRIPPPIVFPDDCNKACEKAILDASNAYWKLTTKRLPQYEAGGTRGRDAGHANAIKQAQAALQSAIKRVKLHCTNPPAQLPEWERAANEPLPS